MSKPIDRRTFVSGAAASGAGVLGLGGLASVLAACGSSSPQSSSGISAAKAPSGPPRSGGSLTIATEAEDAGFDPTADTWDATGILYARSVYDSLAALALDGTVKPYLAQSITPSPDYSQWTITLRPGVKFHNGTPLDAAAVATNIDKQASSAITGTSFSAMKSVKVTDPMTVTIDTDGPWVGFDLYLTSQLGFIVEPSTLTSKRAAQNPIGTGPFVFDNWVPGDHLSLKKNTNYWRPGFPYLNSLTYRPIIDTQSRDNSLKAGQVDLLHSSDAFTIHDFQGNSDFVVLTDQDLIIPSGESDQICLMVNTEAPPVDDIRVRQAMAYAIDTKVLRDTIGYGINPLSTSPFSPGTSLYVPTAYPSKPDLAKARQLVGAYKADKGDFTVDLGTTNVGRNLQTMEMIQGMLSQVGIKSRIDQVQQSDLITNAVYGKYQVYLWRQFANASPDGNYVFWSSATAAPIGSPALNFTRNKDPMIDEALAKGRATADPVARDKIYQQIGVRFGIDLPYLWLSRAVWAAVAKPSVGGLRVPTLPGGGTAFPFGGGVFWPGSLWTTTA